MRKIGVVVSVLTTLSLILPAQSFAQPGMRGNGSCACGLQTQYNPRTVETLSGEVMSIDTLMPMSRMAHGVHLQLKTAKETISVHLGPSWYIEHQKIQIKLGDTIQVKGSRVNHAGQPAIIAAEIKKGDTVLTLRDNSGLPMWSGWRQR